MRNSSRGGSGRILGQISRAMDRTNEDVLHKVRSNQNGAGRINSHSREPPRGPRQNSIAGRGRGISGNGRPMAGMPNAGAPSPGTNFMQMAGQMTPQAQMQMLAQLEEQSRMMAQMMSAVQQQRGFTGGMPQPAINPAFQKGGRSLADRISKPRGKQNGSGGRKESQDTEMNLDNANDPTSSMEVESSQNAGGEPSPETPCRFNLSCTKKDCPFAHQSPAAPPGTAIDTSDVCAFGAACKNKKCTGRHPSPSLKVSHQSEQDCKFFPNCTNPKCPFRHPSMPLCRNGAECKTPGCKFTHVQTQCKFNPCLNPSCAFKHAEGQKRGAFDDKVWTPEEKHVSERKYIDDNAEEELIRPEGQEAEGGKSSQEVEVIT